MNLMKPTENLFARPTGKLVPGNNTLKRDALTDVKNTMHQKNKTGKKGFLFQETQETPIFKCDGKTSLGVFMDEFEEDNKLDHNHELCISALSNDNSPYLSQIKLSADAISFYSQWKNLLMQPTHCKEGRCDSMEEIRVPELSLIDEPPEKMKFVWSGVFEEDELIVPTPLPPTPIKSI